MIASESQIPSRKCDYKMASLDTLLKTMRLEEETGGGKGMRGTGWERWINLLLVSLLKPPPSSASSLACLCAHGDYAESKSEHGLHGMEYGT